MLSKYGKMPVIERKSMTDKEVAWNVIQILSSENPDKDCDAILYCKQVINPPVVPAEPIEVEDA